MEIVERYSKVLAAAVQSPEIKQRLTGLGLFPDRHLGAGIRRDPGQRDSTAFGVGGESLGLPAAAVSGFTAHPVRLEDRVDGLVVRRRDAVLAAERDHLAGEPVELEPVAGSRSFAIEALMVGGKPCHLSPAPPQTRAETRRRRGRPRSSRASA